MTHYVIWIMLTQVHSHIKALFLHKHADCSAFTFQLGVCSHVMCSCFCCIFQLQVAVYWLFLYSHASQHYMRAKHLKLNYTPVSLTQSLLMQALVVVAFCHTRLQFHFFFLPSLHYLSCLPATIYTKCPIASLCLSHLP